jgi:hypothetical protein
MYTRCTSFPSLAGRGEGREERDAVAQPRDAEGIENSLVQVLSDTNESKPFWIRSVEY